MTLDKSLNFSESQFAICKRKMLMPTAEVVMKTDEITP